MRTYLRLISFLTPYRWRVALAVFLGVLTVAGNVALLAASAYVISAAAVVAFISLLTVPVFIVRLSAVTRAFARYFERLVSHDATFRLLGEVRTWFYARLEQLAPARLSRYRSGDLLGRILGDVEELENVYVRASAPVAIAALAVASACVILYVFSPLLALVALTFFLAAGVGVPLLVRRLVRGFGRRQLELRAELEAQLIDGVQGVRDLLALGRAEDHRGTVAVLNRKLGRVQRRMAFVTGLERSLGDLLMNLAVVAVLFVAIPLASTGEIGGVFLGLIALVVMGTFEAVQPLGNAFQFLGRSLGAGERLFEVADAKPDVQDPDEPAPPSEDSTLEFDRVSFAYEPGGPAALEDLSFTLAPGGRVAVVGPSGAGKSTISNLALRFWDPDRGAVRLGGEDLRRYTQETIRDAVAVVSQDAHVFNETLRENLLLADPSADDEALKTALERAQLSEFLGRLPHGLDTYLGESGARLSGGERQRVAVARALLKDAPILVLDEATANLDPVTERELMSAVRELARGRSTLLITHRLVGLEDADEILVLDGGRVAERGTHAGLRKADGLYTRMLAVQDQILAAEAEPG